MTPASRKAALLLTAAGSSNRFHANSSLQDHKKKEYRDLSGKPVLFRSLVSFLGFEEIFSVVITVPPGDERYVQRLLEEADADTGYLRNKQIELTAGGDSRQESILLGLERIREIAPDTKTVLIHDGARPWVSSDTIERVLEQTEERGASIPLEASTSAMKLVGSDGSIEKHLPRAQTFAAQTPQGFTFDEILRAHHSIVGDGRSYIDDAEVYQAVIGKVYTVEGNPENRKITYRSDLP